MAVKTKEMGIDFPLVQSQISVFEKGIKIMSHKLGCSILFFNEVKSFFINIKTYGFKYFLYL